MADDNKDSSSESNEDKDVSYVRKKNIIKGVDNDLLMWLTLLGLGGIVVAPHVRQWVDTLLKQAQAQGQLPGQLQQGQQGQQLPPNGGTPQNQYVMNPPETQHKVAYVEPVQKLNPLQEHEKALAEQRAYEAALEKESLTGSQSISMVPERNQPSERKRYTYEAGSNVSAGYT